MLGKRKLLARLGADVSRCGELMEPSDVDDRIPRPL